jgi:hypothetical protein
MGEDGTSSSPVRSIASTFATGRRWLLAVPCSEIGVIKGPVLGLAVAFSSRLLGNDSSVASSLASSVCSLALCTPLAAGSNDPYCGSPANTSLGFPPPGVARSLAMSDAVLSGPGGLCISVVFVWVRVRGGSG